MAEYNLGRVAFVDKGAYSPEDTYNKWDFVTTVDSTYLFIGTTPQIGKPVTDTNFWRCIADGKPATLAAAAADLAKEAANSAATLANEKAALAQSAATLANTKAGLANDAAVLATEKAALADSKATLANDKAALAQSAADNADEKAAEVTSAVLSAGQLGSIKPTDAAPTPARNGNYTFSIGGAKPAWLTAEAGITTVKAGDGVSVVYTEPSGYSYTHVDVSSDFVTIQELKDLAINQKIIAGSNLFSFDGYIGTSGTFNPQVDSNNVCTDYLPLTPNDTFTATNLQASATTVRQATFFNSSKIFISSYTDDDSTSISLNSGNIPATTAFVVLNKNKTTPATIIVKNGIKSNLEITQNLTENVLDKENTYKLETGVNLFTITGFYVNKTTGKLDVNGGFKCTDYIELNISSTIIATGLAVAGAFRQASFFSSKSASGLISSYTTNDLSDVTLDFNNIPSTARYVRFNTTLSATPTLIPKKYKYLPITPLKVKTAAWDTISATTGYSSYYGKAWFGSVFSNNNDFQFMVYPVTTGQTIHVRGNCDTGNNPIVVFFNSETIDIANFVANSTIPVINGVKFYDAKAVVPAGATHAIVQQRRLLKLEQPFAELVKITDGDEVKKKKIVLIGDSFSQMAGYAGEELMNLIKPLYPEYDLFNYGVGGEKTNEILSRVGAFQMYLTPSDTFTLVDSDTGNRYFTLPATTATVEIGSNSIANSWNADKLNLLAQTTPTKDCAPQTVLIDGVECLLTKVSNSYFLNRTVAAASTKKVFLGAEMICFNIPKLNEDDIAIVNAHQNGGWIDTDDLVAQVQRLVDSLGTKKYIVLSSHYAQNTNTTSLNSVTQRIVQETALRKAFGTKYLNMREYLCSTALYDALASGYWNSGTYPTDIEGEIHPTATDTAYMSNGMYAPMFWCNPNNSADIIHISRRTYVIYYRHIFNIMKALGYFN